MKRIALLFVATGLWAQTSISTINNEAMSSARTKINANFSSLNDNKVEVAGTGISIVGTTVSINSTTTPQKNAAGTWTAKQTFGPSILLTPQASAPGTPSDSELYYDTTYKRFSFYNGSSWLWVPNNPGTTLGDIFYCSETATPCNVTRLAAGTSGYFLKANGAGAAPSWAIPTAAQVSDAFDKSADFANVSTTNTGTSATTGVTPDGLAGSVFGEKNVELVVTDFTTDTATGDGQFYFFVPASLNGMNLVTVAAQVITAGTTNTTDVQLARCAVTTSGNACSGTVTDMLSTKITVDSGENSSASAATAAVIDTGADDVATGQIVRVDVDAVSTTKAKGLIVILTFRLP